jgi:hypothetical protein
MIFIRYSKSTKNTLAIKLIILFLLPSAFSISKMGNAF